MRCGCCALTPRCRRRTLSARTKDSDARIRENALQLSEAFLRQSPELCATSGGTGRRPRSPCPLSSCAHARRVKDGRALATLAEVAHRDSHDPWLRIAILSSVAEAAASVFSHGVGEGRRLDGPAITDRCLRHDRRAGRNPAEMARWFAALPKVAQPEKYLDRFTRGLRLVRARNLQVPGADQAFARLLSSSSEAVQRAAWESSRYFALGALIHRAQQDALYARFACGQPRPGDSGTARRAFRWRSAVLERILHSHPAPEVEASSVDALAAFDESAAGRMILDNWRGYGPDGRKRAISAMLAQRNRIRALLKAVEDGQVERSALDASVRSHLYDDPDPAISAKARSLLESTNSDRSKVVAGYRDIVSLTGDVARGKTLFQENCARCHEPRRQAGRVGPDLSGINNKTKEELITSILNPSYAIEPRFVNYVITTTDGRMYDGIIANETTWSISLRGGSEEGDETVLRKTIASIRASSVSLMPDGLESSLGRQGLADMIAYLRGGL